MRWLAPPGLLLLLSAALAAGEPVRFHFEKPLMGTTFAITCYGEDAKAAEESASKAFAVAAEINATASDYLADSELSRLNGTQAVTQLSPLLADLLRTALELAQITSGLYDPSAGPLTKLWRETRRTGELPAPEILARAKEACDWKAVEFLPGTPATLRFRKPGMSLDLGGMAKGYAADRMLEAMVSGGFDQSCIAAGGDLRLGAPPPGKEGWRIGLKGLAGEPAGTLELARCGVSTSGDLHQHADSGGKRYSHIIDPATGLGMTEAVSITVIAENSTLADALDTPLCLAGADQAEGLGEKWGARKIIVHR